MRSVRSDDGRVRLTVDGSQAEAALTITRRWSTGQTVTDEDWLRLLTNEAHQRWKRRSHEAGRPVSDTDYARFLLSDTTAGQLEAFTRTLGWWTGADWVQAGLRASEYLPHDAVISAQVSLTLMPEAGSYYHGGPDDAAVFFGLDPELKACEFENRMVHELHHVGSFALAKRRDAGEKSHIECAIEWTSAFAEGLAMLAAAGGPEAHPHEKSRAETRARWDRDVANFERDRGEIENFLLDVAAGRLTGATAMSVGQALLGVQGPWYTVGWKMAVTVERAFGRGAVVDCVADCSGLMALYNDAAVPHGLTPWSRELMETLCGGER